MPFRLPFVTADELLLENTIFSTIKLVTLAFYRFI